jgi:hypothetical protein
MLQINSIRKNRGFNPKNQKFALLVDFSGTHPFIAKWKHFAAST